MKQRHVVLLMIAGVFVAYSMTMQRALHLDLRGSWLGGAAHTTQPL